MNLNGKTKAANTYDAIVVGSGISGGWAAKELCEKGLKVLMLERGKPLEHPQYPTSTKDPWQLDHRGKLTEEDRKNSHIQARHYSFRGDNKAFYINDLENPYTEVKRFDWVRGDIVGGRSVLWGRLCYRWSDLDFEANHRGCPYGAYFSTNASTLPAAFATGNLTLRPHSLVNRVLYDTEKGKASGVEIIDTESNEVVEYYARIVFLNAATLATAHILLNSTSDRFPNGLGNGSDQVGRNIMDHHKGAGASASVEGFEDSYYFGRRPTGIYIPRFRNLKDKHKDFIRGYGYQGDASRGGWSSFTGSTQLGAPLKEAVQRPMDWSITFGAYGECLPYAENRATLNPSVRDKWGRPTLSIDAEFKANEKAMQHDMASTMGEMLEDIGYKNVKTHLNTSFPGNANHEMGTARMGRDPKTSVLNAFNQMHEVKNVFITDGSAMTSSACVNPSLTYMALTARACDYAVKELKRLNL